MIVTPEQTGDDIQEIKELLNTLISEVQSLRCERLPANSEDIETLLKSVFEFFPGTPFTAAWLLEYSLDGDPQSVSLYRAIKAAIGSKPTVNRLSRFLRLSAGTYSNYRLDLMNEHSRDGAIFRVVKIVSDCE